VIALVVALCLAGAAVDGGPSKAVTLAAAGDVTLGYHYEEYVDLRLDGGTWGDGGTDGGKASLEEMLQYPFAGVQSVLSGADIAVVNLECPFTARGEKIEKNFNFRARPELAGALVSPGIDVVTLANNHLMDYGPEGITDTIAALDAIHVAHFGAGKNLAEARKPALLTRNGLRFAFLGYLYIGEKPIEPLVVWAKQDKPGVAGAGGDLASLLAMMKQDIRAAHKQAEVVVVYFHHGKEAQHEIMPYEATLAHAAIDDGANLVLGSHPHVLQGAERYHGVPVVYSLGNFVFGGNADPRNKESAIFTATFTDGKVTAADFVPVQITRVPEAPFQPFVLEGENARAVRAHLVDYSSAFPEPLLK
jgi:poly-gamma-glutamate capsule biosynthesis protein CapA/YwtB (metallophosphatase superfamily)